MTAAASLIGRENVYTCRLCGGYTVTVDRDEGTTPVMIRCRASGREGVCRGQAESAGYPEAPRPPHIPAPAWEWRAYPADQIARLPLQQREHAAVGGLFLHRIGDPLDPTPAGYSRDAHGSLRRIRP